MFTKIFHKEIFQGNLRKKHYFEGWYFKNVSADKNHIYSFIAGVSLEENDKHCFVQVINGSNGQTSYSRYPIEAFYASSDTFFVKIGENTFSREAISLNLHNDETTITGKILYRDAVIYPQRFFHPNIMGPFSFIPNMECNHAIVIINATIEG